MTLPDVVSFGMSSSLSSAAWMSGGVDWMFAPSLAAEALSLDATLVAAPLPCAAPPTLPDPPPPLAVPARPPAPTAVGCTALPSPTAAPAV